MTLPGRKGQQPIVVDLDEAPAKFNRDRMEQLKPTFADGQNPGTVTPGNASPITDGAAAMVLTSAPKAQQLGLKASLAPASCLQACPWSCFAYAGRGLPQLHVVSAEWHDASSLCALHGRAGYTSY